VKGLTLRNRVVMPPMQTGRATFDGAVTNRLINFYVRRSSAVGLPIVEHSYVSPTGKVGPKQLGIHDDALVEGLKNLAKSVHAVGAPAVLQISHAGGVANKKVINAEPAGPSASGKSRELQQSEMQAIADEFAQAAERAVSVPSYIFCDEHQPQAALVGVGAFHFLLQIAPIFVHKGKRGGIRLQKQEGVVSCRVVFFAERLNQETDFASIEVFCEFRDFVFRQYLQIISVHYCLHSTFSLPAVITFAQAVSVGSISWVRCG